MDFFYIILDGAVDIDSTISGVIIQSTLVSGTSLDIKHLNNLKMGRSIYGHEKQRMSPFMRDITSATVSIKSKLFRCSAEGMHYLSSCRQTKEAFQGLLVATLSDIAERQYMTHPPLPNDSLCDDMIDKKSNRLLESARSSYIRTRSSIFNPLEEWEKPESYLAGSASGGSHILHQLLHTLKVMFLLPWPFMHWIPGLRQMGSLPVPKASAGEEM